MEHPICALATPIGHSAIGIIRLSGTNSIGLLSSVFSPAKPAIDLYKSHKTAILGEIKENSSVVDDVIVIPFLSPHSYTGEESVEIHCHGNPILIKQILHILFSLGFEPALPGEFTKRAVLSGKIDISQAESIREIIEAKGERALQKARYMRSGSFTKSLNIFRSKLLNITADITAELDFTEEDIQFQSLKEKLNSILELQKGVEAIIKDSTQMEILQEGLEIVIVGSPNTGKSSLMNTLSGKDRAIVADTPGTTRDYLETSLTISGIPVKLVDTAGIRSNSTEQVEEIGIKRSLEKINSADLLILLIDGSMEIPLKNQIENIKTDPNTKETLTLESDLKDIINAIADTYGNTSSLNAANTAVDDMAGSKFKNTIVVINKWDIAQDSWLLSTENLSNLSLDSVPTKDLKQPKDSNPPKEISSNIVLKEDPISPHKRMDQTSQNDLLQALNTALQTQPSSLEKISMILPVSAKTGFGLGSLKQLMENQVESLYPHTSSVALASWQEELLRNINELLLDTLLLLENKEYGEIIASNLQSALDCFSQLTGEITNEDLLGRIFSRFCIGK